MQPVLVLVCKTNCQFHGKGKFTEPETSPPTLDYFPTLYTQQCANCFACGQVRAQGDMKLMLSP